MTDYILLALLVGVMPLRAVYPSRHSTRAAMSRNARYRRSIAIIAGLLALLGYAWWHAGRTLAAVIGGISAYRLAEGEHGRTMSDAMAGAAS